MHGENLATLIEEMANYKDEHLVNGLLTRLRYIKGILDDMSYNGVSETKYNQLNEMVTHLIAQEVSQEFYNHITMRNSFSWFIFFSKNLHSSNIFIYFANVNQKRKENDYIKNDRRGDCSPVRKGPLHRNHL